MQACGFGFGYRYCGMASLHEVLGYGEGLSFFTGSGSNEGDALWVSR